MQALIHFESIQSLPKQIDYLDSLVVKFIEPSSENPNVASVEEREELSSIFLEVHGSIFVMKILNRLLPHVCIVNISIFCVIGGFFIVLIIIFSSGGGRLWMRGNLFLFSKSCSVSISCCCIHIFRNW